MTNEELKNKAHKSCYEQIIKKDGKKLILLDELKEAYINGYKQGKKDYVTNDRSYVIETKELSYIEIAKENGKLKQQIEKMKVCANCEHNRFCDVEHYGIEKGCNKWEVAE